MPPLDSAIVRSAMGTARESPSSSIASMYAAISASFRRWAAALNGRLGLARFVVLPVAMCSLDVFRLASLVTTAQENDQRVAVLAVVHAVARAVVYPQLTNALANALPVAEKSGLQSVEPRQDTCARDAIPEVVEPFG